jgi:hypothetical protein
MVDKSTRRILSGFLALLLMAGQVGAQESKPRQRESAIGTRGGRPPWIAVPIVVTLSAAKGTMLEMIPLPLRSG